MNSKKTTSSGPIGRLVSIKTDTHPLDGIFYAPRTARVSGSVLLLHGNCMNFYTGPSRFLPELFTSLGYACLAFNRRGHDILATLNSRQAIGGAFQLTTQAIADNEYAARWLERQGWPAPWVVGHSNGGMLGVQYVSQHRETPGLILLSAHRGGHGIGQMISDAGLFAMDDFDGIRTRAQALANAGRGEELMLLPGWWYAISANSFLDYTGELPDILELAPRIECPTLYIRGSQESDTVYPAEAFQRRVAGPCEVQIIADSDHFYTGREEDARQVIADWLERTRQAD